MRILVLTAKAIFPLHGGAEIRNFSLLKEASRLHDVYSLSFVHPDNRDAHIQGVTPFCKRVDTVVLPPRPRMRRAASALGSWAGGSLPLVLAEYRSPEMSAALARVIREEKIDVIHAHCLHVGQYVTERGDAAFVYDAHNLEHVLWARFARVQKPLMRAFVKSQIPKFRKWERHVGLHSEKVVMLSDDDRNEYLGGSRERRRHHSQRRRCGIFPAATGDRGGRELDHLLRAFRLGAAGRRRASPSQRH